MVVTVRKVLRPLLITCFIIGLGVYPIERSNPKAQYIVYLSILYCLTIWCSYAYLFYYTVTVFTWNVLYSIAIDKIVIIMNIITTITSAIMNVYHQKRFKTSLEKLITVDNTLKELSGLKMYQEIHTCPKIVVIGWIMCSLIINFCDTIWWITLETASSWKLYLAHILNHSIHINTFMDLLFTFLLWHLHLELCRITRELNFIFGTQITFEIATCLTHITAVCYILCMLIKEELRQEVLMSPYVWFNSIYWFFILIIKLCAINYICESVMIKANTIDKIIHQLTNTLRYGDVRKEIQQFTFQVMHHPLKLTGMNLFYLGNECLRKFCMAIITFVIIMVQMKIYLGP